MPANRGEVVQFGQYFTIGQLAEIFDMDVQLLRYYDAKGLLAPEVRNEHNNYRMYTIRQVWRLATIRYLRRLNYPIKKIAEFMHARDVTETVNTLREQSEFLLKQYEELIQITTTIKAKLDFIENNTKDWDAKTHLFKEYPERPFLHIGTESTLYIHEAFYFYPTVCFHKGGEKHFGAYLFAEERGRELAKTTPHTASIEAGRYLCGYHVGSYETIINGINRLKTYGIGQKLDDLTVAINIVDPFVESHPENYVTELQIRILE